jgi:6-phosphogluconolactonase
VHFCCGRSIDSVFTTVHAYNLKEKMAKRQIIIRKDADDLAQATADWITSSAAIAIAQRGRFLLALSGGSTPELAYRRLADPAAKGRIDWTKVYAFFGDERFVPPEDPRSNLAMASRTLLSNVPIPYGNVFPTITQTATAKEAAEHYCKTIAAFLGVPATSPPPSLDLILLGIGDDGHTASLFPGKPSLLVKDAWFTWSTFGTTPPPVDRITATLPMLNAGREILFLVGGAKKAQILKDVLESPDAAAKYPSAMVNGNVTWLIDQAAAQLLKPS